MSFEFMVTQLARLPNLTHLHLYIEGFDVRMKDAIEKCDQLPRLPTVKWLYIELIDMDFFSPLFPYLFPNLETLFLQKHFVLNIERFAKSLPQQFPKFRQFIYRIPDTRKQDLPIAGRHEQAYKQMMNKVIKSHPNRHLLMPTTILDDLDDMMNTLNINLNA